jgi:murein DD-endopeptidase MepM/ murein hydrolase activator NlpD
MMEFLGSISIRDFLILQLKVTIVISILYVFLYMLRHKSVLFRYRLLSIFSYLLLVAFVSFLFSLKINWEITLEPSEVRIIELTSIKEFENVKLAPKFEVLESNGLKWENIVFLILSLILLLSLVRVFLAYLSAYRIISRGTILKSQRLSIKIDSLRTLFKIKHKVKILISMESGSPFVWGFIKPVIVLPENYKNWSDEKLEHVFLHELAHIKRYDFLTNMAHQIISSLFTINPLSYGFYKRLELEREMLCDELVVEYGKKPEKYASDLLEIARDLLKNRTDRKMVGFAKGKYLKTRLESILNKKNKEKKQSKGISFIIYVLIFILFSPIFTLNVIYGQDDNLFIPNSRPIKNSKFVISSEFGVMQKNKSLKLAKKHQGLDIRAKLGTNVYAAASGYIKFSGENGNYGLFISISHKKDTVNSFYETSYAHLSNVFVKEGQFVNKGELIAETGNSGLSTGPHLHFQIKKDGKMVDPKPYLN